MGLKTTRVYITFIVLTFLTLGLQAKERDVLNIECTVQGLSIKTLKHSSKNLEKISHEYGELDGGFKFHKTDFYVDGKKMDSHVIAKSESYLVSSLSQVSGKGFNKKVYVFTNFYDYEAKEVTRQVTSFPDGVVEKNQGKCTIEKIKK